MKTEEITDFENGRIMFWGRISRTEQNNINPYGKHERATFKSNTTGSWYNARIRIYGERYKRRPVNTTKPATTTE